MLLQKYGYLIKLVICTAVVYFTMKYLLPLFLPFLIAYVISGCILPITKWLHKKVKINKNFSTIVVLILFVAIVGSVIVVLGYQLFIQGKSFLANLPDGIGNAARNFVDGNREKIVSFAMDGTVKTFGAVVQSMIFVVTTIVSAYYLTKDREKIHEYRKHMKYAKEINGITAKLHKVFAAYIKAQLIIMVITAIICTIGLYIMKNQYALLLGIVVSFLDALPLIGAAVILLPWAAYYFFIRNFTNGAIIFCVFVVCYIAREVLEPKIMGRNIGMSPIISIISIYIGYVLFGIIGVVIGPVSYIIIEQLMSENSDEGGKYGKG